MPLATYKDLCIDAIDARRLGEFWSAVLGLELHLHDDGDAHLTGPSPQHTVWINTVPEPVTVKQRVHLDVHAHSVDDVLAVGATPLDTESFSWKVLRDPEGGELCVFERDEVPEYRLYEIVVDCGEEHERLAAWWAGVLGGDAGRNEQGGWSWVENIPGAPFDCIVFGSVPEAKTVKNRIHIDVTGDVDALVRHGAAVLRERDEEIGWTVLADPEGNEFCLFEPQ